MRIPPPRPGRSYHPGPATPLTRTAAPRAPYADLTRLWSRSLTRRQLMRTTTGTAALAMGAGLLRGSLASAAPRGTSSPKPIPGGLDFFQLLTGTPGPLFHVLPPTLYLPDGSTNEPSTITDFNGFLAAAEIQGTGTATDTSTGETTQLTFDVDMRFMDGVYVGEDGRTRRGTFGFI